VSCIPNKTIKKITKTMRKDKYTPYPYLFSPQVWPELSLISPFSRDWNLEWQWWRRSFGAGARTARKQGAGRVARLGCQGGVASGLDACMPRPSPVALLLRASLAPGLSRDIPSQ